MSSGQLQFVFTIIQYVLPCASYAGKIFSYYMKFYIFTKLKSLRCRYRLTAAIVAFIFHQLGCSIG